jgi:hypothetical protein
MPGVEASHDTRARLELENNALEAACRDFPLLSLVANRPRLATFVDSMNYAEVWLIGLLGLIQIKEDGGMRGNDAPTAVVPMANPGRGRHGSAIHETHFLAPATRGEPP